MTAAVTISSGVGFVKENVGPVPVWVTLPPWVNVQVTVSEARGSRSVTSAVSVIVVEPSFPALSIRTVGATLFTTTDVPADVVFTPSDTDTLIA